MIVTRALEIARTLYPVFPCDPVSKRPRTEHGFKDATRDPAQVLAWWTAQPDSLVGVPTGAVSGIVVIDDDTASKPDELSSAFLAVYADVLNSSVVHTTRSGGHHYVFAGDTLASRQALTIDGVKCKSIDTRGNGGYIIYWPSHGYPITGTLKPMPASLHALVTQATPKPAAVPAAPLAVSNVGGAVEYWPMQRDELPAALKFIDPTDREVWYQAGMSIHYASKGAQDGFDIWDDWSATASTYEGTDDCRVTWDSFGKNTALRPRTLASLYMDARAAGYDRATERVVSSLVATVTIAPAVPIPQPPSSPLIPPPPSPEPGGPTYDGPGVITGSEQLRRFEGYVYVEDVCKIMTSDGYLLDQKRFDIRHPGCEFLISCTGAKPTASAWEAFTNSGIVAPVKVHELEFDPRIAPRQITERDDRRRINSYAPLEIIMEPGDVSLFLDHLRKLWPVERKGVPDWHILLSYLKFMMQHKGEKSMWWPFLQGAPGNGKSFVSDTMEYCIGEKYTQRPTPKNIDSQFNASLHACLFIALEDVKIKDDHGELWETLKPMITSPRIEIQPKGIDKMTREVCFNAILNSNSKDGIRKEPDDRRIAPFFSAQQYAGDLVRDGLRDSIDEPKSKYFRRLWTWAHPKLGGKGWAHIAHYLATDPIDDNFNPATECKFAPITSSTAEAIELGLGAAEQEVFEAIRAKRVGFKGGWINFDSLRALIGSVRRGTMTPNKCREMLAALGYGPHPGAPEGIQLTPASNPRLFIIAGHASSEIRDVGLIKTLYETAQRA